MTDREKLIRISDLLRKWKFQADKFGVAPKSELSSIQYIVYSAHIDELESILNDEV